MLLNLLAGSRQPIKVGDAFSTQLYTGNSSSLTITNGLDLAGEGGLVWTKWREFDESHRLIDTLRGNGNVLGSDTTDADTVFTEQIDEFLSDGYSIGSGGNLNGSGRNYVSWAFRRARKFFDIVTYTGDGTTARQIAHNLGVEPGLILVKRLDSTDNWAAYHRRDGSAATATGSIDLQLNTTAAEGFAYFGSTSDARNINESSFTVTSSSETNASGGEYVAYLFAHEPGDDGIIQCGSYTGNGSTTGPVINLGWKPQWLLVKRIDFSGDWILQDIERDPTNPVNNALFPNNFEEESSGSYDTDFTSTGFQPKTTVSFLNADGAEYVYMAIREEAA